MAQRWPGCWRPKQDALADSATGDINCARVLFGVGPEIQTEMSDARSELTRGGPAGQSALVTRRFLGLTTYRGWLAGAGLVISVKVLLGQVETLVGTAVCVERGRWDTISCVAPPDAWQMALTIALLIGLAILIGSEWRVAVDRCRRR